MMSQKCNYCGTELLQGASYCSGCGAANNSQMPQQPPQNVNNSYVQGQQIAPLQVQPSYLTNLNHSPNILCVISFVFFSLTMAYMVGVYYHLMGSGWIYFVSDWRIILHVLLGATALFSILGMATYKRETQSMLWMAVISISVSGSIILFLTMVWRITSCLSW